MALVANLYRPVQYNLRLATVEVRSNMINSSESAGALVLAVVANPKYTVHCSQRSCNLATVEFRRAMVYSSQSRSPVILEVVANPNDTVPGPQSQAVWLKFWQLNLWTIVFILVAVRLKFRQRNL